LVSRAQVDRRVFPVRQDFKVELEPLELLDHLDHLVVQEVEDCQAHLDLKVSLINALFAETQGRLGYCVWTVK